jgi:hypothetical protein
MEQVGEDLASTWVGSKMNKKVKERQIHFLSLLEMGHFFIAPPPVVLALGPMPASSSGLQF